MAHIDTTPVVRAAVWIRPGGEGLERLLHAVRVVHRRVDGPTVQPHVSLLGGIETTEGSAGLKLKRLASRLEPFEIHLAGIDWRDEYYRALFAAVEPSATLERAHRLAHEAFEMMPPDPFEPHVSLAYGRIDEAVKRELAGKLESGLDLAFTATAICLVNASESVPIAEWRTIAERAMGK